MFYFIFSAGSVQSGGSSPSKVITSTTRKTPHIPSASGIPRRNTYNYSENRTTLSSTEKSGSQETSNR